MIAMPTVVSTVPPALPRRHVLSALAATALSGCASVSAPRGPATQDARIDGAGFGSDGADFNGAAGDGEAGDGAGSESRGAFEMPDGARLPFRSWLPRAPATTVALALHGMNDSRDAWEIPAPLFNEAGIALYAPDQRGFGAAPGRGFWAGGDSLADDARSMARLLRAAHPGARLVMMGESMGAAVLMRLATEPDAPPDARYVLVAPAVWGRVRMNVLLRTMLWTAFHAVPGLKAGRAPGVKVIASDNREALIRLGRDPLTIHETRMDAVKGLVDLMDDALAAARRFHAPGLFLYGGKDDLVPAAATAATWRALDAERGGPERGDDPAGAGAAEAGGPRIAYYAAGHHLLMRDHDRRAAIRDVIAWLGDPAAPLPSGAEAAARAWLARQPRDT